MLVIAHAVVEAAFQLVVRAMSLLHSTATACDGEAYYYIKRHQNTIHNKLSHLRVSSVTHIPINRLPPILHSKYCQPMLSPRSVTDESVHKTDVHTNENRGST